MVFVRFLCRTVTLFPRFHTIFFWKKSLCAAHTEKVGNFRGSIYIDYLVLFCLLPHLFAYSIIFYNSVNTLIFIDILGCNLLLPYLCIYLFTQIVLVLDTVLHLVTVSLWHPLVVDFFFLNTSLFPGTTKCCRLILYIPKVFFPSHFHNTDIIFWYNIVSQETSNETPIFHENFNFTSGN